MGNLILITAIKRGFLWNGLRQIFGVLDAVAFFLFSKTMQLMFDIVNVTAQADISGFLAPLHARIYVILSIYMLFKVTVSLITYIVNPDSMTDKSQGVGKLVQRIVVALVMLIFFPFAFNFLNKVQADIIGDETIPKLVLGAGGSYDNPEGIGTEIAYSIYNGTFIYPADCDSCEVDSSELSEKSVSGLVELLDEPGADNSEYKYGYIPFVGFAVGVVLAVVTLGMCVDVAIRVFKLIILQFIAPIPILSYVDPKASKDGAFSKWLKMTASVWLEVFIRLFIVYFILLAIKRLISDGGLLFDGTNAFVKIALVIGLLFFAKDAPKFIYDALGMKPPERGMFAGIGNLLAAGAIAGGAIGAGVAGFRNSWRGADPGETGGQMFGRVAKNIGKGLFAGGAGVVSGGVTSAWAAGTAKDHAAKAALDARNKYLANQMSGNTLASRALSGAANVLGGYDLDSEIAKYEAREASSEKLRGYVNSEGAKYYSDERNIAMTDTSGASFHASKNDLELAIADASNHGGHVVINGHDLGAANGSLVKKISGDAEDYVGDRLMTEIDNGGFRAAYGDDKAKLVGTVVDGYRTPYARSHNISKKEAKTHRNAQIKANNKEAGRKAFVLKQRKKK